MADYGVLSKVRSILKNSSSIKERGLSEAIFVALPPEPPASMVTLEIEEIWSSMKTGDHTPRVKVKFKASTIGKTPSGTDALLVADSIRSLIDGRTIDLDEGQSATLRLANSIIDLPKPTRSVHQYYEALIR